MNGPSKHGPEDWAVYPCAEDLWNCPACAQPSEVLRTFSLPSTDGLVPHVEICCVSRHRFMLPQ